MATRKILRNPDLRIEKVQDLEEELLRFSGSENRTYRPCSASMAIMTTPRSGRQRESKGVNSYLFLASDCVRFLQCNPAYEDESSHDKMSIL